MLLLLMGLMSCERAPEANPSRAIEIWKSQTLGTIETIEIGISMVLGVREVEEFPEFMA